MYGLVGYAIVNFFYGASTNVGHGKQSASRDMSAEVRMFSGHWMVFYGAALATLYSAIKRPWLLRARQCAQGHEVGPFDKFCATCGSILTTPDTEPRLPKPREYDY
jgi:hypothetical protein